MQLAKHQFGCYYVLVVVVRFQFSAVGSTCKKASIRDVCNICLGIYFYSLVIYLNVFLSKNNAIALCMDFYKFSNKTPFHLSSFS